MSKIEKTVFIGYRNTNSLHALAICQQLTQHGYDCFLDDDSIVPALPDAVILQQIHARAHFVLLLTPSALADLETPGDRLRLVIETAIASQRNLVPVTFAGFDFDTPFFQQRLAGRLAALRDCRMHFITEGFFEAAVGALIRHSLSISLTVKLQPVSPKEQQLVDRVKTGVAQKPPVRERELIAEQFFERAFWHVEEGRYEQGVVEYTEAIRLKPDYVEAYNNRGAAHGYQNDPKSAIADYTEALRLQPDYAEVYNNRGIAHSHRGHYDAAIADYTEAIRRKPDFPEAYNNRGTSYDHQKKYAQAIADYEAALRIDPSFKLAQQNLAIVRQKKP